MKRAILIILDGYGEGKPYDFNAVTNANTPFLHSLKQGKQALIKTDSEAVGLLKNNMGGSEVGHMTIGAGRTIPSMVVRINNDITKGAFIENKQLLSIFHSLGKKNGNLHLIGLMSDKNIHSNINHALAVIDMAKTHAKNIFIHFITDGRDSGVHDSLKYLTKLNKEISHIPNAHILSVSGRFYAMDRENNLDRTTLAFDAMFKKNVTTDMSAREYIKAQHNKAITDEFIPPIQLQCDDFNGVTSDDAIMFFNFREDRLRQIGKMTMTLPAKIVTMASVGGVNSTILYREQIVKHTLSEYLSKQGLKQIKISESTKYAHVTYFLNGGREEPFPNEFRVHVPTIKTDRYDKTPKMRAKEITDEIINAIDSEYDCIIVNYSNPDMIGHTGNYDATITALEYLDKCIKEVVTYATKHDYALLITADHGNSEYMRKSDGAPHTAHTLNKVFCVAIDDKQLKLKKSGKLSDIAPTLIDLMRLRKNNYFEGKSLLN